MNKVMLIGRLTHDPELRYTSNGIAITTFSLAVDRKYKNQQGERETDFIKIVAFRKTAELCNDYLRKGLMTAVDGSLQVRKYQTPEGENRTVHEVVVDTIDFIEWPKDRPRSQAATETAAPPAPDQPPMPDTQKLDDDLPF